MAKARISSKSINKFIKKLEVAAENIQREIQSELLLEIGASTEREIEKQKDNFIIPESLIGEFGVGKEGRPDLQTINNAWKGLLPNPGSPNQPTTIKFLKKKRTFGFKFTISRRFYELETTSYINNSFRMEQNNEVNELNGDPIEEEIIPWMEWFLEGHTVQNYHTKEFKKINNASRTGHTLMVPGGFWHIGGQPGVWKQLENGLKTQLTRTTEKFLKRLDTKRLVK